MLKEKDDIRNLIKHGQDKPHASAFFVVDSQWIIKYFNEEAGRFIGISPEKALGHDCRQVFRGYASMAQPCHLHDRIEAGRAVFDVPVILGQDGGSAKRVIMVTGLPFYDEKGSLLGAVFYLRDPSLELHPSELIFDSIADGVFAVDQSLKITLFNRAAEKITGWKKEEAIGLPCSEVFQSSACGDSCILAQSLRKAEMSLNRFVCIRNKDGKRIPVSISTAPLFDVDGNVIGGVETFRDMTSTIQHKMVFDSIADGVFTVDMDWKITSFNKAAENMIGYSSDYAIGKRCHEIFKSSICGETCAIGQSIRSGIPVLNRSITIERMDGSRVPISISASPLMDNNGNVIGGVETFRDISLLTSLRKEISRRYTFEDIISKSASMQKIFEILPDISRTDSNVLILGESGTGKELIARAVHNFSAREKGPFVPVNCGAIPDTLLESELFGYKAGAFTDAKRDRPGRLSAAEKGTLFLDEIGDISHALQVKLLRFLQEKVYEPLGSNKPVKADVRILAATNKDLTTLVNEGKFRDDLFYRLNVVRILLPPLRERKEDIPLLVEHFIKKFNAQTGKEIIAISDAALALLMRYDFSGNIRELENIIEYSFIVCHEELIQPEHLPEQFFPEKEKEKGKAILSDVPMTLEEVEKVAIQNALVRNKWRRMAACRELGISKDTMRRKIQKYGIEGGYEID